MNGIPNLDPGFSCYDLQIMLQIMCDTIAPGERLLRQR